MKAKTPSCCVLLVACLTGCATDTTQIQASYVSPYEYEEYTCTGLRGEAARITRRAREIGARIDETASSDAAAVAVGVILPTSLLFIEGNNPADARRYAELKGQMNAIEEASIRKGCDIEFNPPDEGNMHRVAAAVQRLRRAADQGDTEAQLTLGFLYMEGEGVPQDEAEAIRWFRIAANQGDATAQFNLGVMYHNGEGVPQDATEAVRWYRQAAEQGDAGAQNNLGVMYVNGEGVPQNATEAVQWYRRAAEQGNANAQLNLGSMYEYGTGVERDFIQAQKWYNLAATGFQASEQDYRDEAMRSRDRVASVLKEKEDTAPLEPFGPDWIIAENQPCQLYNPFPEPGETATWSGGCVDGKASGEGRWVWRNSEGDSVYDGSVREGKAQGYGIFTTTDGYRYEGEWREDEQHGHGTYTDSDGSRYEGEWRNGMAHGYGISTTTDGDRYEGEWREDEQHGHGTYTDSDGSRYEGEWRAGKLSGTFTITMSDGVRFEGVVRGDELHGHVTHTDSDGNRYEGEWRDGKPHGYGIFTTTDGDRYEGEWRDGCFGEKDARWTAVLTTAAACSFE